MVQWQIRRMAGFFSLRPPSDPQHGISVIMDLSWLVSVRESARQTPPGLMSHQYVNVSFESVCLVYQSAVVIAKSPPPPRFMHPIAV